MKNAYIVDGVRTPIGNLKGSLSSVRADDLAAHVIRELVKRNPNLKTETINDVVFGCANQAGEDNRNVARMASLLAGLPVSVPAETLNRLCASGLSSAMSAARSLILNDSQIMIAGGVEHMTRSPMVMSKPSTAFGGDSELYDTTFGWRFINPKMKELYGTEAMGETAENLVTRDNITRDEQDQFAYQSHMKAKRATESGRLSKEIAPVMIAQKKGEPLEFKADEFIKPNTTLEALSKLNPAFKKDGSVTAGNSSGLNDGACALLLANEDGLKSSNLKPIARIVSMGVAGVEPRIMGIGPVPASQIALKKAGLTIKDIDVIELNEAFAAQAIAVLKGLGVSSTDERVNPNGGAIALGHPLGMSGARILNTAALELSLTNKRYALVTMCIGVGQGYAVIIERV